MTYEKDQVLGMLWGLHVGDSLGATLEFSKPNISLSHRNIVGGGVFNWKPGAATDDTDLMLAVLHSIQSGFYNEEQCIKNFIEWFDKDPRDIGNSTRMGIEAIAMGYRPKIIENGQGNGSLMRVAPLALLNNSESELDTVIKAQCELTHPHPMCILVDQIFVKLLKKTLTGAKKEEILNYAIQLSNTNELLNEKINQIQKTNWDSLNTTGYCVDSLMCAIWALKFSENFEDAMLKIVNRGDDSDTSGAIAGALTGAYYGAKDIPDRWLSKIEYKTLIEELSKKFIKK